MVYHFNADGTFADKPPWGETYRNVYVLIVNGDLKGRYYITSLGSLGKLDDLPPAVEMAMLLLE